MEAKLSEAHIKCRGEAKEMFKFPKTKGANMVEQVQFYQACVSINDISDDVVVVDDGRVLS